MIIILVAIGGYLWLFILMVINGYSIGDYFIDSYSIDGY